MHAPRLSLAAFFALPLLAILAGCAEGGSVGSTFTNLGGSGGNGNGGSTGGGEGGSAGSTTSTTTTTSTTSTTSTTTTTTSTTTTTTTSTSTCNDTGAEPNETEATAKNLGTIDDCDGSGSSFSGVINGPSDVDWYKYYGQDTFGCVVGPSRGVQFMKPLRICKFVECQNGSSPSVSCPAGTTGDTSPEGRTGCCGTDGMDVDIDCSGSSDDAVIFIRIDNPNAEDCVPYTVDYHY